LPRGHLLALNRSFRRTLEAENKSPRTIEAYTDAVRLLASYWKSRIMIDRYTKARAVERARASHARLSPGDRL
jgi:hypothetical protein